MAQRTKSGLGRVIVDVSRSHTDTHFQQDVFEWVISPSQRPLKQKGRTSLPSAGFEPAIPASKRLQTYALDRTATVSGGRRLFSVYPCLFSHLAICEPLMVGYVMLCYVMLCYVMLCLLTFILSFSATGCKTKRGGFSDYEMVATIVSRDARS